MKGHVSIFE